MSRIQQNITISDLFDTVDNMYVILWHSGTRCAVGKEMHWHDAKL